MYRVLHVVQSVVAAASLGSPLIDMNIHTMPMHMFKPMLSLTSSISAPQQDLTLDHLSLWRHCTN